MKIVHEEAKEEEWRTGQHKNTAGWEADGSDKEAKKSMSGEKKGTQRMRVNDMYEEWMKENRRMQVNSHKAQASKYKG